MLYEKRGLQYPFGLEWSPPEAVPHEVSDGVFWLRMPLPFQLDHINLWLLRDGEHWVIVDTGLYGDACEQAWEQVFSSLMRPEQVSRILVTHHHPDHMGLASWLQEKCACQVHISRPEFDFYYHLRTRDLDAYAVRAGQSMREAGVDEKTSLGYIRAFGKVNKAKTLSADDCEFLGDGAELEIGGRHWRAVSGSGHSPYHLCWYCKELKLFIGGDQALPRISSNVSVFVDSPDSNPLKSWLASCEKLQREIAPDTLVLPAHQEPFVGIGTRMQHLIDGHAKQLDGLRKSLQEPKTALQACDKMFRVKLDDVDRLLAMGETQSHINYLQALGEVKDTLGEDGMRRYKLVTV
ncbi:MAG: MBL fold metallo-hydrolase [Pseudomonadales bacterium]|nr:MAG: MBL fold metallo-hydrolase [Pseudomonadales bacterium]